MLASIGITFIQPLHDWKLEGMDLFLMELYSVKINFPQEDILIWNAS